MVLPWLQKQFFRNRPLKKFLNPAKIDKNFALYFISEYINKTVKYNFKSCLNKTYNLKLHGFPDYMSVLN